MTNSTPIVWFISGHVDYTTEEFAQKYIPKLDQLIAQGCHFVIGDAMGVDLMAQLHLQQRNVSKERVTIYHMLDAPYNGNPAGYPTKGGFKNHNQKDTAMTMASSHDLAVIRSEEEQRKLYGEKYRKRVSGTEKNIRRRKRLHKKCN